jgi:hypothetical protein
VFVSLVSVVALVADHVEMCSSDSLSDNTLEHPVDLPSPGLLQDAVLLVLHGLFCFASTCIAVSSAMANEDDCMHHNTSPLHPSQSLYNKLLQPNQTIE